MRNTFVDYKCFGEKPIAVQHKFDFVSEHKKILMHHFYMLIKILRNTKQTVHYCVDKVASPLFADPIRENRLAVKSFRRKVEYRKRERERGKTRRLSWLYGVRLMCARTRIFSEILAVFFFCCRKFNQRESKHTHSRRPLTTARNNFIYCRTISVHVRTHFIVNSKKKSMKLFDGGIFHQI